MERGNLTINARGVLLGEHQTEFTYLKPYENKVELTKRDYFNKWTQRIEVSPCAICNEVHELLDDTKDILLVEIFYSIEYFGTGRRNRSKHYIYIDGNIYMHNKNINRVPKEVKCAIEEYKSMGDIDEK